MKKPFPQVMAALSLALSLILITGLDALAHQPYFEETDTSETSPMRVKDPEISTALYSSLDKPGDVDFFTFSVTAGQTIEIGMTIPQIEGQENFAPTIGVIANDLDATSVSALPAAALPLLSDLTGATLIEPTTATIFFEPFSRTAYWQRQRRQITFPAESEVHVVVWHAQQEVGRYTLVVGQREVLGGDFDFARKLKKYWTPVILTSGAPSAPPQEANPDPAQKSQSEHKDQSETAFPNPGCNWLLRVLAALIGASELCQ